ncbi:MAG: DUF3124 domain-containing protein [Desulfobacteraceae bacterium]
MKKKTMIKTINYLFRILIVFCGFASTVMAENSVDLSKGQTLYVPVYSHIYSGLKGRPFNLAATLSIRNTDPKYPIDLISVKFYDTDGKLLKDYVSEPVRLDVLVSTRYVIKEAEIGGGSGANFMVTWKSEKKVNPPIIEAIMIGTKSGQGISFVSRGQVIEDYTK